jgi:hypothetical protein
LTYFGGIKVVFGSSGNIKPQLLEVSKIRGENEKNF